MPELTLVSFNAHAGLRPREANRCEPYDLAAVLRSFDADVIVVQESFAADGEQAAARAVGEELGASVFELPFGRARLQPWPHFARDGSGHGIVGLAVVSRLPAREVATVPLGRILADHNPQRGALHVEIQVGGSAVDVVGLHLSSRLPYGPPTQMRRLRPHLPNGDRPAITTGDYNFWGPGVTALMPGWRRAVRGRTWPARRPHSQIDHILVRPSVEVIDSAVLPDVGSDHRPVRARLRVG